MDQAGWESTGRRHKDQGWPGLLPLRAAGLDFTRQALSEDRLSEYQRHQMQAVSALKPWFLA
jgi:hypothetical protein